MKKIFLIATCILIYKIGLSQCSYFRDCMIAPYTVGCEPFCDSLFDPVSVILNSANNMELRLIGGFDGTLTNKILNERKQTRKPASKSTSKSTIKIEPVDFFKKLNNQEKKSFDESLKLLNEDRIKYFNLSDNKRKKVYKQFEKIMID